MKDNNWRQHLDLMLEQSLKDLILETKEYDYAIKQSKDRSKAQIWVALALINQKLNLLLPESTKESKKIPKDELNKLLKTIENL